MVWSFAVNSNLIFWVGIEHWLSALYTHFGNDPDGKFDDVDISGNLIHEEDEGKTDTEVHS